VTQRLQLLGTRLTIAFGGVALLLAVFVSLIGAAPAGAQLPDICDQYPDNEVCDDPIDDGGPDGGPGGDDGDDGGSGKGDGDGSLPFTGYPLTTLILLLLILLAAGLLARAAAAARDRLGRTGAQ